MALGALAAFNALSGARQPSMLDLERETGMRLMTLVEQGDEERDVDEPAGVYGVLMAIE
jgi:hypothetical protein